MGRVLLVEDELLVREVAAEDLGEAGFEVTPASDGDTRASAAEIRFPNGRELSLGNPTTEAVAAAARRAGN